MAYESTPHTLPTPRGGQEEHTYSAITRQDILEGDGAAYVLRGFLSPAECQFYIDYAEETALRDCGYSHSIRRTDRVSAKSDDVARLLFDRLKAYLEPHVNLAEATEESWPTGIPRTFRRWKWYPIGLNETFRLCRYEPGGFFRPHHDGGFTRTEFDRSIKTFMVYLNSDFTGGATHFFDDTQRLYREPDPKKVIYTFEPQAGDALIFNSAMTHDGGELLSGNKYIMRSEVMYSPIEPEEHHQHASAVEGKQIEGPRSYAPDHDIGFDFLPDSDTTKQQEVEDY